MSSEELTRTDVRLTTQQQQDVLLLASRLQEELDSSATLADIIRIGEEAGLSRDVIEEAHRQVVSQPTEKTLRQQMEKSLGNELAAIHLTILWIVATWLGATFLPVLDIFGAVGIIGTLLMYPLLIGALIKRPWFAASLTMGVLMNMLITLSVRFGMPTEVGAQQSFVMLVIPILLALVTSLVCHRVVPSIRRKKPSILRG